MIQNQVVDNLKQRIHFKVFSNDQMGTSQIFSQFQAKTSGYLKNNGSSLSPKKRPPKSKINLDSFSL